MMTIEVARLAGCSAGTVRRWATDSRVAVDGLRCRWVTPQTGNEWARWREYEPAEVERWVAARREMAKIAEEMRTRRKKALAAQRKRCCGVPRGVPCDCRARRAQLAGIRAKRRAAALAAQPAEVRERWAMRGWVRSSDSHLTRHESS